MPSHNSPLYNKGMNYGISRYLQATRESEQQGYGLLRHTCESKEASTAKLIRQVLAMQKNKAVLSKGKQTL